MALTQAVLSWRDDMTLQVRGMFRGFEILSRGRGGTRLIGSDEERLPELFVRGALTYAAQLNAENPVGTVQSIEYALRSLEKAVADETERAVRSEKMLADYREQMGKPYEHEARLKELLSRQAELNAALDLDKGERQIAPPAEAETGSESNEGGRVEEGTSGGVAPRAQRRNGGMRRDRPGRNGDSVAADAIKSPVEARKPVSGPKF